MERWSWKHTTCLNLHSQKKPSATPKHIKHMYEQCDQNFHWRWSMPCLFTITHWENNHLCLWQNSCWQTVNQVFYFDGLKYLRNGVQWQQPENGCQVHRCCITLHWLTQHSPQGNFYQTYFIDFIPPLLLDLALVSYISSPNWKLPKNGKRFQRKPDYPEFNHENWT